MGAAIPAEITERHAARRSPGVAGWLMIFPLLSWLLLFVVAPNAILLVYSFCERGELQGQVERTFTTENYERIVDRSTFWSIVKGSLPGAGITCVVAIGLLLVLRRFSGRKAAWIAILIFLAWFDYQTLASNAMYLRIFIRSINYAGLTTILCVAIGYPVAYFVGKSPPAWRNRLLMLIMVPFWTSFLIRTYAWMTILSQEGLLNGLLMSAGAIPGPLNILYTPVAVVIGLVYAYLPFMILPIYGSVEKLDDSLIEAALDLGATPLRAFTDVIWPLTRPGVVAGVLLVFVPAVGMFAITELMGGAKIVLIGNVIQNQFGQAGDWPFGSALGFSLLLLFAVAYYIGTRRGSITEQ